MNSPVSLLQFTTQIGNAIRRSPELYSAWIVAELSDLRIAGGHCYMELIEKNQAGQTVAKIRAMIWRSGLPQLRQKFLQATGRDLQSGLKVMVQGTATHHPVYGLSVTISDIDPSYTLGDLDRLRREILERLQKEGILNANKSVPLTAAPQRIAVISAAGAAGYGDFINQLDGNAGGFTFYPHLFGAVMQGERTAPSVIAALEAIEMTIDLWDCVVIIRGGGSTTDMNGFDDYELARAVALFPLPVIVGIGHERDRCVLDEIACVRCKTPTAVASFLVDRLGEAWNQADRLTRAIAQYASDRLVGEQRRLAQAGVAVPSFAQQRVEREKINLHRLSEGIPMSVSRATTGANARLDADLKMVRLAADAVIARAGEYLKSRESLLEVLDPKNTLKRGYSVTRIGGHAVTDASQVKAGDVLETVLFNGTIESTVK